MEKTTKKKILVTGIRCAAFLVVFALLLNTASVLFMPAHDKAEDGTVSYITKGYMGEPANSLDMVAVGNSDLYRGLSPMELWGKYGITSYVCGEPKLKLPAAYRILKGALARHNPKVVVLEVDSVYSNSNESAQKHKKPWTLNQMYRTMAGGFKDGTYSNGIGTALGYVFPIVKYHSRWSELRAGEFDGLMQGRHYVGKGFVMGAKAVPYTHGFDYMEPTEKVEKIDRVTGYYLEKIVTLCKKEGIQLVLLELPSASSWSSAKHNGIEKFAQTHKLPFYDLNLEASFFQFDWMTDTKDAGDHLNLSGAEKVSVYFGGILRDTYGLADRRGEAAYSHWEQDFQIYLEKKKEQQKQAQKEPPHPGSGPSSVSEAL